MSDLAIPPFCYLPLCRSVDTWKYVLRPLPSESHAFNTKARCPALMLFEVEEHSSASDTLRTPKKNSNRNGTNNNNNNNNNNNFSSRSSSSSNNGHATKRDGMDVATFLGVELQEYFDDSVNMTSTVKNTNMPSSTEITTNIENPSIVATLRLQSLFDKRPTVSASSSSSSSSLSISTLTSTMMNIPKVSFWKPQGTGILNLSETVVKAANLPKQNMENNHALRYLNLSKNEGKDENKNKLSEVEDGFLSELFMKNIFFSIFFLLINLFIYLLIYLFT